MTAQMLPTVYDTTSWLNRVLALLDRCTMVALLVTVGVMVGVVSAQVVLRYGFAGSLDWSDEVSRLAFVWSIFLAIPLGVRQGAHIGIDVLVAQLPPLGQMALRRAAAVLGALMMFAIAWATFGVAQGQWDELMSTLDWSVGWFTVPVGIGSFLSGLHLVRIAVQGPPLPLPGIAE